MKQCEAKERVDIRRFVRRIVQAVVNRKTNDTAAFPNPHESNDGVAESQITAQHLCFDRVLSGKVVRVELIGEFKRMYYPDANKTDRNYARFDQHDGNTTVYMRRLDEPKAEDFFVLMQGMVLMNGTVGRITIGEADGSELRMEVSVSPTEAPTNIIVPDGFKSTEQAKAIAEIEKRWSWAITAGDKHEFDRPLTLEERTRYARACADVAESELKKEEEANRRVGNSVSKF
jgi:hypothetical protein